MSSLKDSIKLEIEDGKKIYFASDNHLGAPSYSESKPRELIFVDWLNKVKIDAGAIFLLGDLFDFWFEYKKVVPKGFVRVLGKMAEISDSGIPIYFFTGNHDMWMNGYFEEEMNIKVFDSPQKFIMNNKSFLIGHGDGLGPGDKGFKRMKKVFTNPISKFLFKWIHPDIGVRFAQYLSTKNKLISGTEDIKFKGDENEWLFQYCKKVLNRENFNFFVFGHRHLPLQININDQSQYINLGDWISYFSYAIFDGDKVDLKYFKKESTS
ncbi:MAG: UDP-2,3-diacylglucosamine hydrolase [Flavobacteriaceae bacterium]|nr:UDP-2,3-diacylglucosamine hydrolase [Flavobacteriaceae bacterium]